MCVGVKGGGVGSLWVEALKSISPSEGQQGDVQGGWGPIDTSGLLL